MTQKRPRVRLRDPGTCFTDPQSAFHISGGEVKPLPKKPGTILQARIRHGGLIIVDDPPKKKKEAKAPPAGEAGKSEGQPAESSPPGPKRPELLKRAKGLPGFKVTLSNDQLIALVEKAEEADK